MILRRLTGVLVLLFGLTRGVAADAGRDRAPVLLISLDAFRWNYCAEHPAETVRLRQLAADGVAARGLIPVFPSNTFPNHYAIATGLYPSHSGIINNHMFDPRYGEYFHYNQSRSARDRRWWGGEPIWITAVKQGRASACSFWPGSEAEIEGVHATFWKPYDYSIPFAARLDELVGWLTLPRAQRPCVVLFYLEEVNSAGHQYGPESPELAATVKMIDGRVGAIVDRLAAEHLPVNLVIVSDHGMAPCGPDRVVVLEDYVDPRAVQVDFDETVGGLRPTPGHTVGEIMSALAAMPHVKAYRAEDLPARLHIDPKNPRVPPVWLLPDEGWQVERRGLFNAAREHFVKGQHGYDPAYPSMHGILIARGPAYRHGVTIPEVENVDIYNLLCATEGLAPAPNDGDDTLVKAVLK